MIYHIYWGTAGNSGLYIDEIYNVLYNAGYKQRVFVNYYYPFDYGDKLFFRKTEMEHCKLKGGARSFFQAIELVAAFYRILTNAYRDKPEVVNYSYVSRGNRVIMFFLKALKRISSCRLIITCHDVVPAINNKKGYDREIIIKKRILSLADYYLVHTDRSKKDLIQLFDINEERTLIHLFPLMDLSKIDKSDSCSIIKYDFLFIGHMREEKGVSILFEAWEKIHDKYPDLRLCIAGNPDYYTDYLKERIGLCKDIKVELRLGFIKDVDYVNLLKSARCVVFPYTAGTNSGVISTVISLKKDVITSNLDMFAANPFVPNENMFEVGNVESLAVKMIEYIKGKLVSDSATRIKEYRHLFDKQVRNVYAGVINKA